MFKILKLNQISAALQIQLGYVYLVLPLSGLLIMFYAFLSFIEKLDAAAGNSPGYHASAAKGG